MTRSFMIEGAGSNVGKSLPVARIAPNGARLEGPRGFVAKVVRLSVALSREASERRHSAEAA